MTIDDKIIDEKLYKDYKDKYKKYLKNYLEKYLMK